MPTPEVTYRSTTVCRLAGISFRQLDYWARTGLVPPSIAARGSGTQRRYTLREVTLIAMVARLLDHGISLSRARRLVDAIADRDDLSDVILCISGPDDVQVVTNADEVVAALAAAPVGTTVTLDAIAAKLEERAPVGELASA